MSLDLLDFAGMEEADAQHVRAAIGRGDNFQGYIPSDALDFFVRKLSRARPVAGFGAGMVARLLEYSEEVPKTDLRSI